MSEALRRKTPLLLVTGFSMAARQRLVRRFLSSVHEVAGRPTGDERFSQPRIAWLDNQDMLVANSDPAPEISFVACACCSGSLVLTTHLARIMRRGPWSGVILTLGGRAEPRKLLEMFAAPPWKEVLGPVSLYAIRDELALTLCDSPQHPMHELALQQRDLADRVLSQGEDLPARWLDKA